MREIGIYWGCFIPTKQYASELSTRKVLEVLGYNIVELKEFTCCGHPFRGAFTNVWLYLAFRNIAIADEYGIDLMIMCNGCYLSFREALYLLRERPRDIKGITKYLETEGLRLRGKIRILHPIEFFHDVVTIDKLKEYALSDSTVRVAAHYGCHAIRPGKIGGFDNPRDPTKFENIIKALGLTALRDYPGRLICCGATLMAIDPELGLKLAARKISKTAEYGANLLVTTCPYCMEMLDSRQQSAVKYMNEPRYIPTMYYQQLLGLVMGLEPKEIGLNLNQSPIDDVLNILQRR